MTADKPLYVLFAVLVLAIVGAASVVLSQRQQASETEIRLDNAKRFNSIHASTAFNQTQGY
jgi:hypothetical protein